MSISKIGGRAEGGESSWVPFEAVGTKTLNPILKAGRVYRIITDTSQTLSASQLYFTSSEGHIIGAAVRGGQGYVGFPFDCTQVTLTAGTYPLSLFFEEVLYETLGAPAGVSLTWNSPTSSNVIVEFTAPSGSSTMGIWKTTGQFYDLSTTSSPVVNANLGFTASFLSQETVLVAAKDLNGIWGKTISVTTNKYPYTVITASTTFDPPEGTTSVDLLLVAGGGGGGSGSNSYGGNRGGGGGAGGVLAENSVAVNAPVSVVIGSGGAGGGGFGSSGGITSFAGTSVIGGGGGGFGQVYNNTAPPKPPTGASGGGGGSSFAGGGAGGDGTPGLGNPGGPGSGGNANTGGGGGGFANAGSSGGAGGSAGTFWTNLNLAAGGNSGTPTGSSPNGAGSGGAGGGTAGAGRPGAVYIKVNGV